MIEGGITHGVLSMDAFVFGRSGPHRHRRGLIDEHPMTTHDLIVQRPATPSQLVLLFHGVGSSARDLVPLGEALAPHLPDAAIVSLQAPEAAGPGWQWFSVQGVTEADRPARVAAACPASCRRCGNGNRHAPWGRHGRR